MIRRIFPLLALLLSACASQPPARLSAGPFVNLTPNVSQKGEHTGNRVRWGGTIAKVDTGKDETCFQVVSHPLDSSARPITGDSTNGRFIACAHEFYDPVVYAPGRQITVVGTLQAPQMGKIGEYQYLFPRVAANDVYLWPKVVPLPDYPPFWYSPGTWGPWGPWGGGWW